MTVEKLSNYGKSDIIKIGAISGALNPDSNKIEIHAIRYYELVRNMKKDVKHKFAWARYCD